jgi:hypothetical protein
MRFVVADTAKLRPTTQLFVLHDVTKTKPYPKLCVDCKHFRVDHAFPNDLKMGRCIKEIKINLVDGSQLLPYAEVVRTHACKDRWWDEGFKPFHQFSGH